MYDENILWPPWNFMIIWSGVSRLISVIYWTKSSLTIQVKPPRSFLTNTSENGWLIHLNLSTLKFCPIVMCVSDRKQMSQFLYNQSEISVNFKISVKPLMFQKIIRTSTLKSLWFPNPCLKKSFAVHCTDQEPRHPLSVLLS